MILVFLPFALQGLAMMFDEFYFHRRRGLPLWERIGHPLDTLSVLVCYVWIFSHDATPFNMNVYLGLCIFSTVLVTKDEFVHTTRCEASENWLHSILFILHPVTFFCAGLIWKENLSPQFILIQPIVIFLFLIYQIVSWSPFGKRQQ